VIAVLDASVAVALAVDEAGSNAAESAVAGLELLVPEAFWVEISNALIRKVRLGYLPRDHAFAAYALLRRRVARSVSTERLGPVAMELALDLSHSVYDCFYLAAAIAHGVPLLTADRALHAAAAKAGYGPAVRLVG
jgi:predicted nucleic acid-binding protein